MWEAAASQLRARDMSDLETGKPRTHIELEFIPPTRSEIIPAHSTQPTRNSVHQTHSAQFNSLQLTPPPLRLPLVCPCVCLLCLPPWHLRLLPPYVKHLRYWFPVHPLFKYLLMSGRGLLSNPTTEIHPLADPCSSTSAMSRKSHQFWCSDYGVCLRCGILCRLHLCCRLATRLVNLCNVCARECVSVCMNVSPF